MTSRLWNRFTYWLERSFLRGAQYRLLLIAALIGLISILGGTLVLAAGSGFETAGEAIWWSFLRLTDPGYLGDDVGTVNRTVSTVLTVLGYVVFLGALVAVMTQWLDARMERLERGLTPVTRNDHVLVLGWTNRSDAIVRELLVSEGRVKRFLRRHGTRDLHVVVMAEEVTASLAQDLRDAVGEAWDEREVTLRSGTPLRVEHLSRVDHLNASVIILPGSEFDSGGVSRADASTVKTLLSLRADPDGPADGEGERGVASPTRELPLVVAEIFDARKMSIAENAYPGPLELVASDAIVSRLLAQNIRHPGLSHVYNEILTHEGGSEIYLREHPELNGRAFGELGGAFPASVPLGVVRQEGGTVVPYLNPSPGFLLRPGDRFAHLAGDYQATSFGGTVPDPSWTRGPPGTEEAGGVRRSILILGWNHKVPALIREFSTYGAERFEVRILSTVPAPRREKLLSRHGGDAANLRVEHLEGDYTEPADLEAADPVGVNAVLLVGSDRLSGEEESDARTILGSLLLKEMGLPDRSTQTILELLDPENLRLLNGAGREVLISPLIVSHMLAHVALRPELRAVFAELFTAGGPEITFLPVGESVESRETGDPVTFAEIQRAAHARGEIALGVHLGPGMRDLQLVPPPDAVFSFTEDLQVVSLVTYV